VILERCGQALEREFYLKMTRKFGWSKRTLLRVQGLSDRLPEMYLVCGAYGTRVTWDLQKF